MHMVQPDYVPHCPKIPWYILLLEHGVITVNRLSTQWPAMMAVEREVLSAESFQKASSKETGLIL